MAKAQLRFLLSPRLLCDPEHQQHPPHPTLGGAGRSATLPAEDARDHTARAVATAAVAKPGVVMRNAFMML
jgi:hypothetical protein